MLVRTVIAALVGGWLFERMQIPAGALVGAMVAVAALNLVDLDTAQLPEWARFLAFAGIGWALGQQFTRDSLQTLRQSLVPTLIVVAGLLLAGGLLMLALRAMGFDSATAFLASAPGGISQMGALSTAVGADAAVVVTTHLVRIVAVVAIAPLITRLLTRSG